RRRWRTTPSRAPGRSPGARAAPRGRAAASGVQRLDLGGEVLRADPALELQRRRQLALGGGEIARQDREPLDLLEAREPGVDLVDDLLDARLRLGGLEAGLRIERDERRDVRASVADDERLRDLLRGLERVLEVLRRDVLAARRDDDVLLPVGEGQEALRVELTHVPGAQPAVGR